MSNYFVALASTDVSGMFEKKGRFDYLSWAHAVKELLVHHPDSTWEVKRYDNLPYQKTEAGCFVEVAVTVNGITRSQIHPVLDGRNNVLWEPNAFDINTSIQRCLVKAIALHGLGLSIYAGEDLWNLTDSPKVEPTKVESVKEEAPKAEPVKTESRKRAPVRSVPNVEEAPKPEPEPVAPTAEAANAPVVEPVVEEAPWEAPVESKSLLVSATDVEKIRLVAQKAKIPEHAICEKFEIENLSDLPMEKLDEVIQRLEARAKKVAGA